ncbi:MAG: hypothetical protein EOO51_07875 [Flavobacterium sp.]|nr:MAG: hypothetical protein EOO51_07875 [Flavobacterium sp.]
MFKKYLKYLRIAKIDILVYRMTADDAVDLPQIGYEIETEKIGKGVARYFIVDKEIPVHSSFLYSSRRILSLLNKKGPVIGDCVTNADYRGKSIYPFVINKIAREQLHSGLSEVFINVNPDNVSSIRGIEKAGFQFFAHIRAKRFLLFYFDVNISKSR